MADGVITKTWYDPCPRCGGEVTGVSYEVETVRSNPYSVISVPDPACPYDADDPGGPDCTCTAITNFAPDPMFDELIPIGATFTMQPCGDMIRGPGGEMADWKMYQQETPA